MTHGHILVLPLTFRITGYDGIATSEGIRAISEDVKVVTEGLDLSDIGSGEDNQKVLRNKVLEYSVLSPTTETVPGEEYTITIKPDADLLPLFRPAFRKAPKEMEQERRDMERLLERGIVESSSSCYGTSNDFVEKRRYPDVLHLLPHFASAGSQMTVGAIGCHIDIHSIFFLL
jgi:hypothetical protein